MYYDVLNIFNIVLFSLGRLLKRLTGLMRKMETTDPIDIRKVNFSKLRYEPVSKESIIATYKRVKRKVIELGYKQDQMLSSLHKMMLQLEPMYDHAEKSCCGQLRSNGYFSLMKFASRYLQLFDKQLSSADKYARDKDVETASCFVDLMLKMVETFFQIANDTKLDNEQAIKAQQTELLKYDPAIRRLKQFQPILVTKQADCDDSRLTNNNSIVNDKNNNDQQFTSLPLFTPFESTICESVYEGIAAPTTQTREIIYRENFAFWLDNSVRICLKFYTIILCLIKLHFYEYPRMIFSPEFRSRTVDRILRYLTVSFPFELWNAPDTWIFLRLVDLYRRNTNTLSSEVLIPKQNSIVITKSPDEKVTFKNTNRINFNRDRTVRCKFIKPKNVDIENCDKLMLHCHGGGFFGQNCDSHEVFLREWVNYNGIPILTVDYQVKVPFPGGLQDCFDVYVWLRKASEKEIRSVLGFLPKKIVLDGDSAGGNLAFAIVLVLNDLRTEYRSQFNVPIPMLNGIVCIYTPFLVQPFLCPSRTISILDIFVSLGIQLVILDGLNDKIPDLRPNTRLEALMVFLFPNRDTKAWFECSQEQFNERLMDLAKLVTSPYMNTLYYENFDTLTDVPIHMISAEYCSFLDESITIAKLYKGPCKIDVMPDLCHAFLNLAFASNPSNEASMFCCQQITKMFDEIDAKYDCKVISNDSSSF